MFLFLLEILASRGLGKSWETVQKGVTCSCTQENVVPFFYFTFSVTIRQQQHSQASEMYKNSYTRRRRWLPVSFSLYKKSLPPWGHIHQPVSSCVHSYIWFYWNFSFFEKKFYFALNRIFTFFLFTQKPDVCNAISLKFLSNIFRHYNSECMKTV